jgi:hypothetical protein
MNQFPTDLVRHISSYLSASDLCHFAISCTATKHDLARRLDELKQNAASSCLEVVQKGVSKGGKRWRDEHGRLHRDNDLPALIDPNGTKAWFQHGELCRKNGMPCVVYPWKK